MHIYSTHTVYVDAHAQAAALPNIYFPMQTVCPVSALRTLTSSALSDTHTQSPTARITKHLILFIATASISH